MPLISALRNRSAIIQLGVSAVSTAVIAVAASVVTGAEAALWCVAIGVICMVAGIACAAVRYAEIVALSTELDEVLHGGRKLTLSACREGDVAVLRNEAAKMVAQLVRLGDQLKREKAALSDAMADISHQIRTPLTALSLAIPALEDEDARAERKRIGRNAERLIDRTSWLVSSLLRMAKADAGALEVSRTQVRVADAVRRAVEPLETALDLRGVTLVEQVDDEAMFTGDVRWTAEAVGNIVKNCMEHTPEGGAVTISASEDVLATRIVVEDTGSGIAPEDLPRIFDRFYRGSHGASDEHEAEGFGIGLSLALSLVSIQGGIIRVSNTPQGGARFEIAFPKLVV